MAPSKIYPSVAPFTKQLPNNSLLPVGAINPYEYSKIII